MTSASPNTRFDNLVLNLPHELRQEILNYYLEEAIGDAIAKDVKFNYKLYAMYKEILGIYRNAEPTHLISTN